MLGPSPLSFQPDDKPSRKATKVVAAVALAHTPLAPFIFGWLVLRKFFGWQETRAEESQPLAYEPPIRVPSYAEPQGQLSLTA